MQRFGVARRVDVTTFSFTAAASLVTVTDRITTVHARLVRLAQVGLPMALLPLPIPMPMQPMKHTMQWHKYRTQNPRRVRRPGLLHGAVGVMDARQAPAN